MDNIKLESLKELKDCQSKIKKISSQLYDKAIEVWRWEEENLGKKFENESYSLNMDKLDCVEIYRRGEYSPAELDNNYEMKRDDYVCFELYDSWAYGGYDEKTMSIPLYKLVSDDWREKALKEHIEKLEKEKIKKEKLEEEAKRKKEEQERAEYERLKAKFE